MDSAPPRGPSNCIAAIATPVSAASQAAIGIVRLSGQGALDLARSLFVSLKAGFAGFKPYRLHHGRLVDAQGTTLDEVLAAWFPGPGSYTGEDVIEFSCHGGHAVLRGVLQACLDAGARQAEPGEFTKRAFLNGKIDLTQAEAVAEVIAAPAAPGLAMAHHRLGGRLADLLHQLRSQLEDMRVQLATALDFPEDELECMPPEQLATDVTRVLDSINELLANEERARLWHAGALVVLAGPVNAGKSSLFNALLGKNRALVADTPGTTRDFIEETLLLDGMPVRLADSAGLRETSETVELQGLELTRQLLDEAQLVLLTIDAQAALPHDLPAVTAELDPARVLCLANKADGFDPPEAAEETMAPLRHQGFEVLAVSAQSGHGLDALLRTVARRLTRNQVLPSDLLAPNVRQAACLRHAAQELQSLLDELNATTPYDLLSVRLEVACRHLSELTGEITPQAVLDAVFSRFCIGK